MNPETWIAWCMLALAAGGLTFALSRRLSLHRRLVLALALLVAGAVFASLYLFGIEARPRRVEVAIRQPTNGTRVEGHRLRVEGVVRPASSLVTLVMRSESDEHWWVQDVVRPDPQSGLWFIDAYVGTPKVGARQSFTIIALASDDGALFNLLAGRRLSRGMTLGTVPLWNRSSPHVIWRER